MFHEAFENTHLLRCTKTFGTATYKQERLAPYMLRALYPGIFEQPIKKDFVTR